MQKLLVLLYECTKTGAAVQLGLATPADLCHTYPPFFRNVVNRYIEDGRRYLRIPPVCTYCAVA
jgi:hypothetical protein